MDALQEQLETQVARVKKAKAQAIKRYRKKHYAYARSLGFSANFCQILAAWSIAKIDALAESYGLKK